MGLSATRLPSIITSTVVGASESVFEIPSLNPTPALFSVGTDVKLYVSVNGTTKAEGVDYTRTPAGYVTFGTAVAVGSTVKTWRETYDTAPLVSWPGPTAITQTNLNKDSYQWLYLLQEVVDAVGNCLSLVINSVGAYVWDFENHKGINCLDPTDAQDVATKTYVDTTVTSAVAAEAALRVSGDAATLAAAIAYTRAFVPTISYISSPPGDMLVQSSQTIAAGVTRIYFPCRISQIVVCIEGVVQRMTVDYTFTVNNNYIDLVSPSSIETIITAFIFKSASGTTTMFDEEVVSVSAGDTVVTFVDVFDNALVHLGGIVQRFGTDYTHVFGTNTITFTSPIPAGVSVCGRIAM